MVRTYSQCWSGAVQEAEKPDLSLQAWLWLLTSTSSRAAQCASVRPCLSCATHLAYSQREPCSPPAILGASVHPREHVGDPGTKGADGAAPLSQLFKGKFYHCLGVDIRNITNRSDCVAANYKWVHHKYNFDNLGQVSVPATQL